MKRKLIVILLLCSVSIFGIYHFSSTQDKKNYTFPTTFMITNENNFFDYQPGYECAAFSSSYVLRHYGYKDTGLQLFGTFPDKIPSGDGAFPTGIVSLFESRGFTAEFITDASIDDIKQEVSMGVPVIVFIHVEANADSLHYTHYVPVVGYDENNFYFAESLPYKANYKDQNLAYNRKTDIETFKKLWKDIDATWQNPYFKIRKENN